MTVAHSTSRWDDDVVFRNQARGTENKGKKEFVNVRQDYKSPLRAYADGDYAGSSPVRLSQTVHGEYI